MPEAVPVVVKVVFVQVSPLIGQVVVCHVVVMVRVVVVNVTVLVVVDSMVIELVV